jgi:hypothetical protein
MSLVKLNEAEVKALIDFNKQVARHNLSENGDVDYAIVAARRAKEWAVYGHETFKEEF